MASKSSPRSKAFRGDALNGEGAAWGVEQTGGVVYECIFVEATARRLAQLNDSMPDAGWNEHKAALERNACDLTDPGVAQSGMLS